MAVFILLFHLHHRVNIEIRLVLHFLKLLFDLLLLKLNDTLMLLLERFYL